MFKPSRGHRHLIEAVLGDGSHHHFSPQVLDIMLDYDLVTQFKRANGWATVGIDPIRAKHTSSTCFIEYGPERRASVSYCRLQ